MVKAFNTRFAGTLVEGQAANQPLDVLVASTTPTPSASSASSSRRGPALDRRRSACRAHELEAVGYLHMALQQPLGTEFDSAVKVLG